VDNQQYFTAGAEDASERERLALVARLCDPLTIRLLTALGVGEGWNCLEVGAGAGSVACWLARRVEPGGTVVATDLDTRFLRDLNVPNLEIRQHDILKDDLEEGLYDLVHSRALLMHLPEPEKAFARMASAVRPGGWILIEEPDYGSQAAASPGHPLAESYDAGRRVGFETVRRLGILDPYFGRRTRELVEGAGFVETGHEGIVQVHRGGEIGAMASQMTSRAGARAVGATGELDDEQRARARRMRQITQQLMADPSFMFVGPTMFAAWGRRAASLRQKWES
jgi:SAM-dependent methyltransferase